MIHFIQDEVHFEPASSPRTGYIFQNTKGIWYYLDLSLGLKSAIRTYLPQATCLADAQALLTRIAQGA